MNTFIQNLRVALRQLKGNPGFFGVAVATLGLGIGATTAIFSLVDGYLLRPLPFPEAERLVELVDLQPNYGEAPASYEEFRDWRKEGRALDAVTAFWVTEGNYSGAELPERVRGALVAEGFSELLGLEPRAGRWFIAEEESEGGAPVVVLAESFWRSHFAGDPAVIGAAVNLEGEVFTVVGVAPAPPTILGEPPAMFLPLARNALSRDRGTHYLKVLGRLRPDVGLDAARAEIARLAESLKQSRQTDHGIAVVPLREQLFGDTRPMLMALLGAVTFLLLIAVANVTTLLLARASDRAHEFAVRAALGAGRRHLLPLVLTESFVLVAAGTVLGVLVASWGTRLLVGALPPNLPQPPEIAVDLRVLAMTTVLALAVTILLGLTPALLERGPAPARALGAPRTGGTSASGRRARSGLVVAELALSFVLLVGAGLLGLSFVRLARQDPGFDRRGVLTAAVTLRGGGYEADERRVEFLDAALQRFAGLPGVTHAGLGHNLPLTGSMSGDFVVEGRPTGRPEDEPHAEKRIVSEGYFGVLRIPLLYGRLFTSADRADGPRVVLVNETLARRLWPGEEVLGKRIRSSTCGDDCWEEVVGVVGDVREYALDESPPMAIYYPFRQIPPGASVFAVRGAGDPSALAGALRHEVAALDPHLPLGNVRTMEEWVRESLGDRSLSTALVVAFAGAALLLAAVGIGGLMAYVVRQRTREIGIRIAVGAAPASVMSLILRQSASLVALGLALGGLGALVVSRLLRHQLYGVGAVDPLAYGAAALVFLTVAVVASYLPTRRAARIDPMTALRQE